MTPRRPTGPTATPPGDAAVAPRPPDRRGPPNPLGLVIVASAALVAVLVTFGIFVPALGALGEAATRDPATLPSRITVCGRDWTRDPLARALTRDEAVARTDAEPVVVEPGLTIACPPEIGAAGSDTDAAVTVIFVRSGDDAFVAYDLVGEPQPEPSP